MKTFSNILYVSSGLEEDRQALTQALAIARGNDAALSVLIVYPPLPDSLEQYRATWEDGLAAATRTRIDELSARQVIGDEIEIAMASPRMPAEEIIKTVLRGNHDLVIKPSETIQQGRGHKAIDMELLRKCPCPVWLARSSEKTAESVRVAVAVDPGNQEPAAVDLAVRLLKTAAGLPRPAANTLQIISCWDCEYEGFLRNHPFARIPEDEVDQTVQDFERSHSALLVDLIRKADLADYDVNHLRGRPEDVIPDFVRNRGIDILVMGTVARTGIPGFVMGNTAENIVQKLSCTLLALKPPGFISPVKAY